MSRQCREFAANLLDECRTSDEVQLLLKQDHPADYGVTPGGQYPRLRLAINYAQKEVSPSHHCAQTLTYWPAALPLLVPLEIFLPPSKIQLHYIADGLSGRAQSHH